MQTSKIKLGAGIGEYVVAKCGAVDPVVLIMLVKDCLNNTDGSVLQLEIVHPKEGLVDPVSGEGEKVLAELSSLTCNFIALGDIYTTHLSNPAILDMESVKHALCVAGLEIVVDNPSGSKE
jgi:hypothetical protein